MRTLQTALLVCFAFTGLKTCIGQNSGNITLIGKLPITNLPIHDVWGYTDTTTGNQYALLCASDDGLRVIDVTDATDPQMVGTISGGGVEPVDVKTWGNLAYTVAESPTITGKIIDLSDPSNPFQVGTFPGGHNITISENGYLYLSSPGVRIFNLNPDPLNPELVYSDNSCNGHDISIIDDRLFDFSDNCGTRIFDLAQPDTLVLMGTVPPSGIFHHSGWTSEDGNHLFVCDELASTTENDITVWDISDVQNPFLVDSFSDPASYVHNLYVHGDFAFVSYYRAGFRVFDVSDPTDISLIAEYDTDSTASGPGYGGNFGLYTFWGTDKILASDEGNGLYIFGFQVTTGIEDRTSGINDFSVYPNPATDQIGLIFSVEKGKKIAISITDALGKEVFRDDFTSTTGQIRKTYPLSALSEGIYSVAIQTDGSIQSQKLIVNK